MVNMVNSEPAKCQHISIVNMLVLAFSSLSLVEHSLTVQSCYLNYSLESKQDLERH